MIPLHEKIARAAIRQAGLPFKLQKERRDELESWLGPAVAPEGFKLLDARSYDVKDEPGKEHDGHLSGEATFISNQQVIVEGIVSLVTMGPAIDTVYFDQGRILAPLPTDGAGHLHTAIRPGRSVSVTSKGGWYHKVPQWHTLVGSFFQVRTARLTTTETEVSLNRESRSYRIPS